MKNCKKHPHECESCIKEKIEKLEALLAAEKAKLPDEKIIYICNHHGICNCWNRKQFGYNQQNAPYYYSVTNANTTNGLALN